MTKPRVYGTLAAVCLLVAALLAEFEFYWVASAMFWIAYVLAPIDELLL